MTATRQLTHEQLLHELESLVSALTDALAIMAGTIAEATQQPGATLKHLYSGQEAARTMHGQNEWRDRLLYPALVLVAQKAAPLAASDPSLQTLITTLLAKRPEQARPQ